VQIRRAAVRPDFSPSEWNRRHSVNRRLSTFHRSAIPHREKAGYASQRNLRPHRSSDQRDVRSGWTYQRPRGEHTGDYARQHRTFEQPRSEVGTQDRRSVIAVSAHPHEPRCPGTRFPGEETSFLVRGNQVSGSGGPGFGFKETSSLVPGTSFLVQGTSFLVRRTSLRVRRNEFSGSAERVFGFEGTS
jgi:hypothetical protein